MNSNRREFLKKSLLVAGMAIFASRCKNPDNGNEPDPKNPTPNPTNPTVDSRSVTDLENKIRDYILNTMPAKKHKTFAEAHADVSKFIEDLILDKKYDIGHFSSVEYIMAKLNQKEYIDNTSLNTANGLKVTKNTTCKLRSVSKSLGHSDESVRANTGFHTIACDDK